MAKKTKKNSSHEAEMEMEKPMAFERKPSWERGPKKPMLSVEEILGEGWPLRDDGRPDFSPQTTLNNLDAIKKDFQESEYLINPGVFLPAPIILILAKNAREKGVKISVLKKSNQINMFDILGDKWPAGDKSRFDLRPTTIKANKDTIQESITRLSNGKSIKISSRLQFDLAMEVSSIAGAMGLEVERSDEERFTEIPLI